jgi:hypothetical protein
MYYYYKDNQYVGCGNDGEREGCEVSTIPPELPNQENQRISEIKSELAALDLKRIRPIAEGDAAYLATLNAQLLALRTELQGLL